MTRSYFARLACAGAAAALSLGLTSAAMAQAAPDAPPPPKGEHHMMMRMQDGEHAEHMAKHLRDVLQLRPDQDGALKAFLEAMKPPMHKPHEEMEKHEALTTPQRLDKAMAMMNEHLEVMKQHVAAVKTFYAQLSPSQQKAFDALAPEMMHRHMMQMHEHMGMPGGMHGDMGPMGEHAPPPPPVH
ncbi:MAG: Spy/CpxP family protein refolding chaperone [Pseudomonadota bacterium]|jgi:protein CpxP